MPKSGKTSVIIRKVDKQVWMQFRRICLDRQVSATAMLKELIVNFVQNEKGA